MNKPGRAPSIRLLREADEAHPGTLWSVYGFETGSPGLRRRRLLIYLPAGYTRTTRKRFPVVYMLDGQNAFDLPGAASGGWKAERAMEELSRNRSIKEAVLVGVGHSCDRYYEYLGWGDHPDYPHHPAGDRHVAYLMEQVLPFVEAHYRVRPRESFLVGASAGGIAALYTAFNYPHRFAGVACLSAGRGFYDMLCRKFRPRSLPFKLFLSCGGRGMDREFGEETLRFFKAMRKLGECTYLFDPKASHHERAWSRHLKEVFTYLLGQTRAASE